MIGIRLLLVVFVQFGFSACYVAFDVPRPHRKRVENCNSRKHRERLRALSLHLCNEAVTGMFYGNGALFRGAKRPCLVPRPLLLPQSRLQPCVFRKTPQPGATRLRLSFQLRSSIDGAFHPGIIVWLPAAVRFVQNCETVVPKVGNRSHDAFLLPWVCPSAINVYVCLLHP